MTKKVKGQNSTLHLTSQTTPWEISLSKSKRTAQQSRLNLRKSRKSLNKKGWRKFICFHLSRRNKIQTLTTAFLLMIHTARETLPFRQPRSQWMPRGTTTTEAVTKVSSWKTMLRWLATQFREAQSWAIDMIFGAMAQANLWVTYHPLLALTILSLSIKESKDRITNRTSCSTFKCKCTTFIIKLTTPKPSIQVFLSEISWETSLKLAKTHLLRRTRKSLISWTIKKTGYQFN